MTSSETTEAPQSTSDVSETTGEKTNAPSQTTGAETTGKSTEQATQTTAETKETTVAPEAEAKTETTPEPPLTTAVGEDILVMKQIYEGETECEKLIKLVKEVNAMAWKVKKNAIRVKCGSRRNLFIKDVIDMFRSKKDDEAPKTVYLHFKEKWKITT